MPRKKKTPREKFADYVAKAGGARALSDETGIPCYTIWHILNGHRGIGRQTARVLNCYDSRLRIGDLMQVEADNGR
jgi:hypothetical protein